MEWKEIVLEINSMSPQKLNYLAERYSSWLDKVVRGRRGYARTIPFAERVTKLEVPIGKTKLKLVYWEVGLPEREMTA